MSSHYAMLKDKPAPMGFTLIQPRKPAESYSWGDWEHPVRTKGDKAIFVSLLAAVILLTAMAMVVKNPEFIIYILVHVGAFFALCCVAVFRMRAQVCRGRCDSQGVYITSRKKTSKLGDFQVSENFYPWNEISKIDICVSDDGEGGKNYGVRLVFAPPLADNQHVLTHEVPTKDQAEWAVRSMLAMQVSAGTVNIPRSGSKLFVHA